MHALSFHIHDHFTSIWRIFHYFFYFGLQYYVRWAKDSVPNYYASVSCHQYRKENRPFWCWKEWNSEKHCKWYEIHQYWTRNVTRLPHFQKICAGFWISLKKVIYRVAEKNHITEIEHNWKTSHEETTRWYPGHFLKVSLQLMTQNHHGAGSCRAWNLYKNAQNTHF